MQLLVWPSCSSILHVKKLTFHSTRLISTENGDHSRVCCFLYVVDRHPGKLSLLLSAVWEMSIGQVR